MAGDSTKSASIKLTLQRGPFKESVKDAEKEVKGFADNAKKALKGAFSDGLKGAGTAVSSLVSDVKSAVGAFAGIGGALGITELIRMGTVTSGIYKGVAFGMRAGTGDAKNFRDMMSSGAAAAQKYGKNVDELGAAAHGIWERTGNEEFTRGALDTIAMVSRASTQGMDKIGALSGTLNKGFGITNDQLEDTLGLILSLSNKGGANFDELSSGVQRFGVIAKQAGMSGEGGLKKMLGIIGAGASGAAGMSRNMAGAAGLMDTLSQAGPARSMLLMRAGMTGENGTMDPWDSRLKGKDPTELIKMMVAGMGGKKERMALTFEGDQLSFLSDLGAVYRKAFEETKGGEMKKRKAGMDALDEAMKKASTSMLSGADMQKMANDAMKDGPAKLDAAIEKMRASFNRPEIADAIGKLADALPKLAEYISGFVEFATKHPVGAGAALVGGSALKGGLEASLGSIFASGGKALASALGIGGKAAGTAVAGEVAAAAPAAGKALGMASGAAAAGAFAAAAAGVGAAIWQGFKLGQETVTGEGWSGGATKKDKGGSSAAWREFLHDIGAMDDAEFQKQWDAASGIRGPETADARGYEEALRQKEARNNRLAEQEAAGMSFSPDDIRATGESSLNTSPGAFGPRMAFMPQPQGEQRSADDARLFADMLRGSELKVRITNPEAIRVPGAGGPGGSPRPGYLDR